MHNIHTQPRKKTLAVAVKTALIVSLIMNVIHLQALAQSYDLEGYRNDITGKAGDAPHLKDIPTGSDGYLYRAMGFGSQILDDPSVNSVLQKKRMNVKVGLGYSCGKFDPTANIEQMVNQIKNKIKKLPGQFVTGVTSAIASLPAYLLNKVNPTLYNTITKTLDDGFDFFDFQFKSCQQIEGELKNDGSDYYQILKKSSSENLGTIIKEQPGEGIEDNVKQVNEEGGDKGVKLAGGQAKGGSGQKPVDFVSEVVVAGYNLSLGRTDATSTSAATSTETKDNQLANVFKSPEIAKSTLIRMYGSVEIQLDQNNENPIQSTPGNGIQLDFAQDRLYYLKAMKEIVKDERSVSDVVDGLSADIPNAMKDVIKMNVVPQDIQDLRALSEQARLYQLELRADQMATIAMILKLNTLKSILKVGTKEPNLQQSPAKSEMELAVYRVLEDIERDLYQLQTRGN